MADGGSSDVADLAACDVCFEEYVDPRILTCGHTFCKECLSRLAETAKITCPNCRNVTEKRVKDLPKNYKLIELIQKMETLHLSVTAREELVSQSPGSGRSSNDSRGGVRNIAVMPCTPTAPTEVVDNVDLGTCHKPKLLWQCNAVGNKRGQVSGITDIAFTKESDVIVCEYGNERLQCFTIDGKCKSVIGAGKVKPVGVAVGSSNNIFATDNNSKSVQVLSTKVKAIKSWTAKSLGDPSGIATLRNNNIVVCDMHHNRISIHDCNTGNIIRKFGEKKKDVNRPLFVCTDSHDRIIVTSLDSNAIQIFNSTGVLIKKITDATSGIQINEPRGVTVEPETDSIVVALWSDGAIATFDSSGKYIENSGYGQLTRDDIQWPYAVAHMTGGLFAVGEGGQGHHAVKLFQIY